MKTLDVDVLPLDKKVLIEASAGTGKTYTIGLIVIRLLKEKLIPIDKIVLITFTKSATEELKNKTAEKIREYTEEKSASLNQREKSNLLDAVTRIDEMQVFTIHGFCQCLLSEFSYETKNFEKKEVLTDQSDIINRIAADFWRHEIKNLDSTLIEALPDKFSPEVLKTGIERLINFPGAEIHYEKTDFEVKTAVENYLKIKKEVEDFGKTEEIKYNKDGISINKIYARKYPLLQRYNLFLEEYNKASNNLAAELQFKLAGEVRAALQSEKEKLKVMCFNDMIENVYAAVQNDNNKSFFNAVQRKYDAILVDEFQDTDNMQFEIFSYLFQNKPFFMIGDPKQSIYRFRGGDIYAYLLAKDKVNQNQQYTMGKNFRSQEKLLKGLEKLLNVEMPFENEKIPYIKVEAGKDLPPLTINGAEQKPFVLRNIECGNKDELKTVKTDIVNEISRLLYENNTIIYGEDKKTRRIKARDIAILTRTNNEAKGYRDALKNRRNPIPAIVCRSDSVFQSNAADFLMRLLTAFVNSKKENNIRAVLMEIKELEQKDIAPFAAALTLWEKQGIMRAIHSFFDTEDYWKKMLACKKNGERDVTNIRQLASILNEEEIVYGRVPERTLRRFAELVGSDGVEENEEKLETDDDAVKIMTIHVSKGLQFPIVFVPDIMLTNTPPKTIYERDQPLYHLEGGNKIIIEYEISNREDKKDNTGYARQMEKIELFEESARNFYVAVTRPIYRLYVVNSYNNKTETYSKGQSLCLCAKEDENILITNDGFASLIYPENTSATTKQEENKSPQRISKPLPKNFRKETSWQKTSFTGIARHIEESPYTPAKKRELPLVQAGKRMGTLLHSIFEELDFMADKQEIELMVENKLKAFAVFSTDEKAGERKEWVQNQAQNIIEKQLEGTAGKLKEIAAEKRITELDFFMNTDAVNLDTIKKILGDGTGEFTDKENFAAQYLNGAIDLVFQGKDGKYYIIDWKSNNLSGYSKPDMEEAMYAHAYHLQYHIYAVALKRWLEQTKYDFDFTRDFGGVYYVFIRGVNNENNDGIYFVNGPDIAANIIALDKSFSEAI